MEENLHALLLDILKKTVNLLEKNNIWYSLACGSVLGAVREGGFIPWDLDVDLFVKITDVPKIQEILSTNNEDLILISYKKDTTSSHDKVSISGANHSKIHLDLYPLIGVPDNLIKQKIFIKKCHYLNKIIACKYEDVNCVRKKYKALLFRILQSIEKYIPDLFLRWEISSLENRYSFDKSLKLSYIANDGHYSEAIERDIILQTRTILFEGISVKIPMNYDRYLRQVYGNDYMTPKKY